MMTEHIVQEVPVVQLTQGPKFHFFGYYEKFPWDVTGRYLLALEVDFINRSPDPDDIARICLIDTEDGNSIRVLAETRTWNWQQGCMLQWLGSAPDRMIIYNDRDGDQFVSKVMDVVTGETRVLSRPV